jgi:hypothetical protein
MAETREREREERIGEERGQEDWEEGHCLILSTPSRVQIQLGEASAQCRTTQIQEDQRGHVPHGRHQGGGCIFQFRGLGV